VEPHQHMKDCLVATNNIQDLYIVMNEDV